MIAGYLFCFVMGICVGFILLMFMSAFESSADRGLPYIPTPPIRPGTITVIPSSWRAMGLSPDDREAVKLLIGYLPEDERVEYAWAMLGTKPEVQS